MKIFTKDIYRQFASLAAVVVAVGIAASAPRVDAQTLPVGTWDFVLSGNQRGVAQITFLSDFTLTGWELVTGKQSSGSSGSQNSPRGGSGDATRNSETSVGSISTTNTFFNGIADLSGVWTFDHRLRVIGVFSENGGTNSTTNGISFSAVVKPRRSNTNITMRASRDGKSIVYSGVPLRTLPDISGNFYGIGKKDNVPFTELFTLTPSIVPNVYGVSGIGPNTSYDGVVAVSSKNQMGFVSYFGVTNPLIRSVVGSYRISKGTGVLKGFTEVEDPEDAASVKLNVFKQP